MPLPQLMDPFHGASAMVRAARMARSLKQPWGGARRVPGGAGAARRWVAGAPCSSRVTRAFLLGPVAGSD